MRFRIDSIFSSVLLVASFGTVFASIPDPDVPAYERERAMDSRNVDDVSETGFERSSKDQGAKEQDADERELNEQVESNAER